MECTIRQLRASLTPTFIDAPGPTRYTRENVEKVLRKRLPEQEHHLAAYPFSANETMKEWAEELTHGARSGLDKARAIYEKLSERRTSGEHRPVLQTAQAVFEAWANSEIALACTDHTILFVALARAVDVDAYFVSVEKDADGKIVQHACAAVFADGRVLLVDTFWRWFGVPARQYTILDDIQATAMLCLNRPGHPEDLPYLRAGLKLWPDCLQGQLGLAVALARAHQWPEAHRILAAIREPQMENYDAACYWRLRGEAALGKNDLEQAEKHLRKALSICKEESGRTSLVA